MSWPCSLKLAGCYWDTLQGHSIWIWGGNGCVGLLGPTKSLEELEWEHLNEKKLFRWRANPQGGWNKVTRDKMGQSQGWETVVCVDIIKTFIHIIIFLFLPDTWKDHNFSILLLTVNIAMWTCHGQWNEKKGHTLQNWRARCQTGSPHSRLEGITEALVNLSETGSLHV